MTDCTERHMAARAHDLAGEGQEGIPDRLRMTDCTERHMAARAHDPAGAASTDGSVGPR